MANFSDAPAATVRPAGVSNPIPGAVLLPADRGRITRVLATCPGLPSSQGTGVPGFGVMAHAQEPVIGQASDRKPQIYTTRVDAVGVKGSHPARGPA
jgi:hypothetical protein